MIGEKSGCLEIIAENNDIHEEIVFLFKDIARKTWEKCAAYDYLKKQVRDRYKLTEKEYILLKEGSEMPLSFVDKFKKKVPFYSSEGTELLSHLLSHKKNPNTQPEVFLSLKDNNLIKVKCSICGREHLTDRFSFECVKWQSCIGAECLKYAVEEEKTSTISSYNWNTSTELVALDSQLAKIEELSGPLTYYGGGIGYTNISFAYISDLHLLHHLPMYSNEKTMLFDITRSLYLSLGSLNNIIFNGDISSDPELTIRFLATFTRRFKLKEYKEFKNKLDKYKKLVNAKDKTEDAYKKRINILTKYITHQKNWLNKFDFDSFEKYVKRYCDGFVTLSAYESYKNTATYKKLKISARKEKSNDELIYNIIRLTNILYKNKIRLEELIDDCSFYSEDIRIKFNKSINEVSSLDFNQYQSKDYNFPSIYLTLGNHEFIGFKDINSGVLYYQEETSKLGIKLLHNTYIEKENYIIYGGTGFAKYDDKWNANTVVCCDNFTWTDEFIETDIFESNYEKALEVAKIKKKLFICVSHYPYHTCHKDRYDPIGIYITGHNHRNELIKNSDTILYADNQIGYKNNNYRFKIARSGVETNPYYSLGDGLYKTSVKDYLQFYRYIGEDVGDGNLLYKRCINGKASLYVIKRKGYYGFFIIGAPGSKAGISIVNGGITKKITDSLDVSFLCENFDIVLSKYLQLLLPLRQTQEKISEELKELGLYGIIHGCIVDIDFNHHIMINPIDGSLTFYYSSEYGLVETLNDFKSVIRSFVRHSSFPETSYAEILDLYKENEKKKDYLLATSSTNYLIDNEIKDVINENYEQVVSKSEGVYAVSRKINPLQRIFVGHVLRDFDLRLTETKQQAYRKYLYTGRLLVHEGIPYKIVEDDGSELVVVAEIEDKYKGSFFKIDKDTELTLLNRKKLSITDIKKKISNKKSNCYWLSY